MGAGSHLHAGVSSNPSIDTILQKDGHRSLAMDCLALLCGNADSTCKVSALRQQFSYAELKPYVPSEMPPLWTSSLCG